ncbi:MAG: DUF4442 domain-containing protein [Bacteroidetes bacterium]|nr:DUF4442 domain-containing protein [Bacteroidota bacterium]
MSSNSTLSPEALAYQKRMCNPVIFWFAMLLKLPTAIFWRLKMVHLDEQHCTVSIPYFWRSQNPFKSIYFAALAGAAELSTGALCQLALARNGAFSMLVIDFRAEYSKKASTKIHFTCKQGKELFDLIDALQPGETTQLTMHSIGKNQQNEEVAQFFITWSFKRKA